MHQYLKLMTDILKNGHDHEDRTGVGRRSVFGRTLRFDLSEGQFPLVTTRKVFVKGMIDETLWFLTGSIDALVLEDKGVNIWKAWTPVWEDAVAFAKKQTANTRAADLYLRGIGDRVGTVGPMYGAIWRGNYDAGNGQKGPDQIAALIEGLRANPYGSRHTVTAQIPSLLPLPGYSPQENVLLGRGALAPCHCFFQCFVSPPTEPDEPKRLSLKIQIRSSDGPVGLPYNIAQYAMLLMMFAQCAYMEPHELIVDIGDAHVYHDQIELMAGQLDRHPFAKPHLAINPDKTDIFSFTAEDFKLDNYLAHPVIKYPVAT